MWPYGTKSTSKWCQKDSIYRATEYCGIRVANINLIVQLEERPRPSTAFSYREIKKPVSNGIEQVTLQPKSVNWKIKVAQSVISRGSGNQPLASFNDSSL